MSLQYHSRGIQQVGFHTDFRSRYLDPVAGDIGIGTERDGGTGALSFDEGPKFVGGNSRTLAAFRPYRAHVQNGTRVDVGQIDNVRQEIPDHAAAQFSSEVRRVLIYVGTAWCNKIQTKRD